MSTRPFLSHIPSSTGPKKGRRKDPIEQFIGSNQVILQSGLNQLRYMVLVEGLLTPEGYETCPYRTYIWSILLRVPPLDTQDYLNIVAQGPPGVYAKIRNDTFRTLTKDLKFKKKVSEEALIRLLCAFAWDSTLPIGYVQGMNVLAAPFLYISKSETEAFALFQAVMERNIPLYILPTLNGVHTGLRLVDICLRVVDPELFGFLQSKFLKAEIYAFASVLTLSACTPPLSEVLHLWDFYFAYGVHMNVLVVVAQLILIRTRIFESSQPMTLLRTFPDLQAKELIKLAISFIPKVPEDIYSLLVRHPFDSGIQDIVKNTRL
ncbi:hypothetical protein BABINDRAFT_170342 [Babjeviella inositovora NRRL Y-12698]|uniref:Rab-GAP TBC domain-containing protein n=1 Tax=Babjeviella inositovora NRRL Y-12698 TaxID=984486 RepID=A0A1E3QX81_9ASCO|nr:uncharacterized protein BABINDRAFT_170342 [Babjeviella inositovora NRRL Y-12698]ODQ81607.1 hypothetical protein BABINDRAFT_170342 [Babjeviella inositovora NRRL Y-12698]